MFQKLVAGERKRTADFGRLHHVRCPENEESYFEKTLNWIASFDPNQGLAM
jgi:hypothetical protein